MRRFSFTLCLLLALTLGSSALADPLEGIGIDQRLNEQVPTDLSFVDETGKAVVLADYLGEKPAILVMAYYECPRLCTMVLNGVAESLAKVDLEMGRDYQVITVSINPAEGPALAATKKAVYVAHFGRGDGKGWHFLTGRQEAIARLASATGFRYRYDEKEKQFSHASGIMLLTPRGKLSHYFLGIDYPPRDLRLALVEASEGKIGTPTDRLALFCSGVDLSTGKYSARIFRIVEVFGSLCMLALAGLIFALFRSGRPLAN